MKNKLTVDVIKATPAFISYCVIIDILDAYFRTVPVKKDIINSIFNCNY